ncbi:hypothetical protein [Flavobacterium sp.]|uniref:hypothetical protein n=1 Tax=Flavobacterium sp. TaxID=239 RepID=UPI003D6B0916
MKNIIKNTVFVFAIFALMATRCAKDAPETIVDEDQASADAIHYQKKEQAIADWNSFKKKADNLNAIAQNNRKTLMIKMKEIKGKLIVDLDAVYARSGYDLLVMQDRLKHRDLEFTKELKKYDESSDIKNQVFQEAYLSEIVQLNILLEKTINE